MATPGQQPAPEVAGGSVLTTFDPHVPEATPFADSDAELWQPMLESQCNFVPEIFLRVMHNLIKNPNIMSTHLFRADIFYDSLNDHSILNEPGDVDFSSFTKHMQKAYQPWQAKVPGYKWQQTYVRQLVPRNRQLDKDLVQTCHFFVKQSQSTVSNLILYIPHVSGPEEMPWYHPKVQQLAFLHQWSTSEHPSTPSLGSVSVYFRRFPDVELDQRLQRTALQLLTKIHKHGRGQQAGYVKRVHHDQVVPQQRFQDTYARLKAQYAKRLIENWAEDTDPTKHVFEDLGIAAFLIELWRDMYDCTEHELRDGCNDNREGSKPKFPGFVDIGCGNGLLVYLLNQEGYHGWGFDARSRKTWQTFPPETQNSVKEMILVPEILHDRDDMCEALGDSSPSASQDDELGDGMYHNGMFRSTIPNGAGEPVFIISNHADELTPWTPLIAYLNGSSFIAIPCCSHNLAGAKWRAHPSKKHIDTSKSDQEEISSNAQSLQSSQAAETGSLKRPTGSKKMPSAYASLCDYVADLAKEVGFQVDKEMLRIPSTRNACILGRQRGMVGVKDGGKPINNSDNREDSSATPLLEEGGRASSVQDRLDDLTNPTNPRLHVRDILTRELSQPIDSICQDWVGRAKQIARKKGDGH